MTGGNFLNYHLSRKMVKERTEVKIINVRRLIAVHSLISAEKLSSMIIYFEEYE